MYRLTPVRIGPANDRDLGDARYAIDDVLDFARVHVDTAGDDHVLLAIDDVVTSVLVAPSQIADSYPAIDDRFRGFARAPPVTVEQIG